MSTIVITGGHHNSALVIAKELILKNFNLIWIGHKHSSRDDTRDSAEYIEVSSAGIPFYNLNASRLIPNLKELITFPLGLFSAINMLRKIQPACILSFGGYLGGTVALAGAFLNIPIYLHEQTVTAGRSNKFIAMLSRKVYLTWPESAGNFPAHKVEVVGLPLRKGIISSPSVKLFNRNKPTLLVMGGKQGSTAINHFIFNNIAGLLTRFNIVHQTGTNSRTQDYEHAITLRNSLGSLSDSYLPLGYIMEADIGRYLNSATLYLGRSGAHICYELLVIGLKAVLVPLMSTHDFEQLKNAEIVVSKKLAVILSENTLNLQNFEKSIKKLNQLESVKIVLPLNASKMLVESLIQDIK